MDWSLEGAFSSVSLGYVLASAFTGALIAVYGARRLRPADERRPLNATQPVPKIKGKWPGNIDILLELIYSESSDYPTEGISRWCKEYGPTFDMGILWSHQIVSGQSSTHVGQADTLVADTSPPSADPEVGRAVLHDLDSFEKSEKWNRMCHTFLGNGIFAVDGPLWERVSDRPGTFASPLVADRSDVPEPSTEQRHGRSSVVVGLQTCNYWSVTSTPF